MREMISMTADFFNLDSPNACMLKDAIRSVGIFEKLLGRFFSNGEDTSRFGAMLRLVLGNASCAR